MSNKNNKPNRESRCKTQRGHEKGIVGKTTQA